MPPHDDESLMLMRITAMKILAMKNVMVKIWITHIIFMILTPGIVVIYFLGGDYDIHLLYCNSDDEVGDDDDGNDDSDDDDKHKVMLW